VFSPFLILKDIQDRHKVTNYLRDDVELALAICVIALVACVFVEPQYATQRFIEVEKKVINFSLIQIPLIMVIDFYYFGGRSSTVLIMEGICCALLTAGLTLYSIDREIMFNF